MNKESNIPVVKPTDTENLIWTRLKPHKTGGLVRNSAFVFRDVLDWPQWSGEPLKLDPEHWENKLLAGCRGEWFAHVVDGRTRILDVGCGFGFPSFYLARYGHEVVGVDPSPSEIATAKELAKRIEIPGKVNFLVVEESSLPFADGSFDAATLSTSLECVAEPEVLLSELKRVLKPGSPIAIEEEDRSLDPKTHPVWEKANWAFFDGQIWIWYETRICHPYLDRRYMISLEASAQIGQSLQALKDQALSKNKGLPVVDLKTSGITLEDALSQATEAFYSEARGYDPSALKELLVDAGFAEVKFYALPDGAEFAHSLASQNLLARMPDNVRGILRALVKCVRSVPVPISTFVSCTVP